MISNHYNGYGTVSKNSRLMAKSKIYLTGWFFFNKPHRQHAPHTLNLSFIIYFFCDIII
jgi:hypothetical protein